MVCLPIDKTGRKVRFLLYLKWHSLCDNVLEMYEPVHVNQRCYVDVMYVWWRVLFAVFHFGVSHWRAAYEYVDAGKISVSASEPVYYITKPSATPVIDDYCSGM